MLPKRAIQEGLIGQTQQGPGKQKENTFCTVVQNSRAINCKIPGSGGQKSVSLIASWCFCLEQYFVSPHLFLSYIPAISWSLPPFYILFLLHTTTSQQLISFAMLTTRSTEKQLHNQWRIGWIKCFKKQIFTVWPFILNIYNVHPCILSVLLSIKFSPSPPFLLLVLYLQPALVPELENVLSVYSSSSRSLGAPTYIAHHVGTTTTLPKVYPVEKIGRMGGRQSFWVNKRQFSGWNRKGEKVRGQNASSKFYSTVSWGNFLRNV